MAMGLIFHPSGTAHAPSLSQTARYWLPRSTFDIQHSTFCGSPIHPSNHPLIHPFPTDH